MVVAMRFEPATLTRMSPSTQGLTPAAPWQLFHAGLMHEDERLVPHPQLTEALPQVGTDSWKVFPDGRMETTWRLRPNLTWHDGAPLLADDFVLADRFARAVALPGREGDVDEVIAPDPRTIVIRYRIPNPEAGQSPLEPLPRHTLGPALGPSLEQLDGRDALEAFAFPAFTTEFVGLGPYRLVAWEPGAFITGVAFPGYVGGRPQIGRVQLVWIADANTAVANLLSGAVHLATDLSVAFEQVSVLRREWTARGEPGSVILAAARTIFVQIQYRPEYQNPAALRELPFRQALAHAIDKQAIVDAVLDGEPGMADTLVAKDAEHYPELDRMLTKYPLDLRRADQLLSGMGLIRDGEGFYMQSGRRTSTTIQVASGAGGFPREALILADSWKRAGIEAPVWTLSAAEQLNQELGSTYPALRITRAAIDAYPFNGISSANISRPATRWLGANRGGYSDPEIDRLTQAYDTSLDRHERNRAVVQAMKLLSDQAVYFPLYHAYDVVAHAGALSGPRAARQRNALWKVEAWHWK
jgi:peptide/nickel transport system substrate-binding protein